MSQTSTYTVRGMTCAHCVNAVTEEVEALRSGLAGSLRIGSVPGAVPELLAPALAGGFADSKPLQILAPQMAERRFEPIKWHVRTLLKDLDTAVKLSQASASATPMSGLAAQLMRLHGQQGALHKDPATLIELFEEKP